MSGWGTAPNRTGQFNNHDFMAEQKSRQQATASIVRVKKFKDPPYDKKGGKQAGTPGKVQPHGNIDVEPLVNMQDGDGNTQEHSQVYNRPYMRMHANGKALIMDPEEGDVGVLVHCDRDISKVMSNQDKSAPDSQRHHSMSDGVFMSTCMSKEKPTCYHRFTKDHEIIHSPDDGKTSTSYTPNGGPQSGRDKGKGGSGQKGKIAHNVSEGDYTADVGNGSMAHTIQQGDMSHTAKQGSLNRSAGSSINDSAPKGIGHKGPTGVTGSLGVSQSISAMSFGTSSDERIKSNIRPMTDVLNRVMQLEVVEFDRHQFEVTDEGELKRDEENKHPSLGLIAQQVEAIFPDLSLVSSNEDTMHHTTVLSLVESKIGILVLAAFQEYVNKNNLAIAAYEARIQALEQLLGVVPP